MLVVQQTIGHSTCLYSLLIERTIYNLRESKAKQRLLALPGITPYGLTPWIYKEDFFLYGFKTGNGMMRHGIPEGFPKGMQWQVERKGNAILRVRCLGFTDKPQLTHHIRSDIRKVISQQPCIITGSTSKIEVDHRAGNKQHPLHIHVDDVDKQSVDDFMPLCRSLNQIKREACKQCVASGSRPERPPFLGGGPMKQGEGCNGCFWMQPELYR